MAVVTKVLVSQSKMTSLPHTHTQINTHTHKYTQAQMHTKSGTSSIIVIGLQSNFQFLCGCEIAPMFSPVPSFVGFEGCIDLTAMIREGKAPRLVLQFFSLLQVL